MQIPPAILALQRDDAPQRQFQTDLSALVEQWRGTAIMAAISADLDRFADGGELNELPQLGALFVPGEDAVPTVVQDLVGLLCAALAEQPLGQVPLRYSADPLAASMLLAQRGGAMLTLEAIDGAVLAQRPPAVSARFTGCRTWLRVLAGQAVVEAVQARAHRADQAELASATHVLAPGSVRYCDGQHEALVVRSAPRGLVLLQLQRRAGPGDVVREYRLADGSLLHQSAVNPHDSRLELAATLLGRMGRSDAAPVLAAMALEPGSRSLRWQALRECLGLNSAIGFAALARLADQPDDPLAAPAAALRTQLLSAYPQLAEASTCPA